MLASRSIPITHFAPAERVPIEVVHRQAEQLREHPLTAALLNSVLNHVFILNAQRQIVFCSRNVASLVPDRVPDELLGLRPGEALGCIHQDACASGCGTSEFCQECGAARAILRSLAGERDLRECRLTRVIRCQEESLDLLVLATPFELNNERFAILSVADISHEKRRRALERIFFHDVMNLAGGVEGLLEDLRSRAPTELQGDLELSHAAVQELLEEIQAQRDLAAAEREELVVTPAVVNSLGFLRELAGIYQTHPQAEGRRLVVAPDSAAVEFTTDSRLLRRVLGNLTKNALEASRPGQTVTVACHLAGARLRFGVHNPTPMSREAELQVFQRSFSTKGPGRGLGTYSAKLLSERYLGGRVGFATSPTDGTTFFVVLPLSFSAAAP